jgi:Fic family protein
MGVQSRLNEVTTAKGWLDGIRPLPALVLSELNERFTVRLTHHSTAIEGNTLSQSETQIVLEKGITIGGHSLREHLEVIGHRDALEFVIRLANNSEAISERSIRELHSLVMRGQEHEEGGAYRTLNVMAAGTEYRYPDSLHVPSLMQDYVAWLNTATDLHPVLWASEAHLRFVTIHPFRDGNGRVGRLLLNLALMRFGYPMAVIRNEQRTHYIEALAQAQTAHNRAALEAMVVDAVVVSLREVLGVAHSAGCPLPAEAVEWVG